MIVTESKAKAHEPSMQEPTTPNRTAADRCRVEGNTGYYTNNATQGGLAVLNI